MNRDLVWPGIVAASTVVMTVVVALGLGPPIAPVIAVWFVFVCPGLPYVRLLNLREPLSELLLAIALSLSIEAVVSLMLLWRSAWTSGRMLQIVVALTVLGVLLDAQPTIWGRRSTTSAKLRGIDHHRVIDLSVREVTSEVVGSTRISPVLQAAEGTAESDNSEYSRS